jgi:hypothetical protein
MINLNPQDSFIKADILRKAYISYEESLNPKAPPFVSFPNGMELGIVSGRVPDIATSVSSILCRSLEDAKYTNGGHLPPEVVERVQLEIISPFGIAHLWGVTGHRFVLSRPANSGMREIIASILVGRSKDTIFFLTGRYNNLQHSMMKQTVDLNQPNDSDPNQKWFDRFAFPDIEVFKPKIYHQIANFVVNKECREKGIARFLIENIVRYYSRDNILKNNNSIDHSQFLLCGKGFWQIGDPPWLPKMKALGFYLRGGAESFFMEHDWAPLPPVLKNGKVISNVEYNMSYGLPLLYEGFQPYPSDEHLLDRIPQVISLSQNPKAKLQYFQAMYNFI